MNLEKETRRLLKRHLKTSSYEKTSKAAGVGIHWLQSFNLKKRAKPNSVDIQKLYDFLKGEG